MADIALQVCDSNIPDNPLSRPGTPSGPIYFRGIQVFRGIAAACVVLYHVNAYMAAVFGDKNTLFRHFDVLFSLGWCFFFVVSGFLMAYLITSGTRYFLPRRLLRIYPTYWLAVILVVAFRTIFFNITFHWNLARLLCLYPLGKDPEGLYYPLGVEWTLIYEIFFYFVCAFFANRFLRRAFPGFLLLWLVIIGVAAIFYRNHDYTLPNFTEIWFSTNNILFIGGALGFYLYRVLPPFKWLWTFPCFVFAIPVFVMAEHEINRAGILRLLHRIGMDVTYPSLLFYTLGFLLILVPWLAAEKNRPKSRRLLVLEKLGDYSYALYLVHVPVILYIYMAAKANHPNHNALACLALSCALIAGILLGRIDVRIHNRLKAFLGGKKAVSKAAPHRLGMANFNLPDSAAISRFAESRAPLDTSTPPAA